MGRFVAVLTTALLASGSALATEIPTVQIDGLVGSGFVEAGELDGENCEGNPAVFRFNVAKEGGTYTGLEEAAADHKDWLYGKGHTDVEFYTFAGGPRDDAEQVAIGTVIVYPSWARMNEILDARDGDRDEGYDAFVAKYGQNTDGFVAINMCLKKIEDEDE